MVLDNGIGDEGCQVIADALKINSCLQSLDISCNIEIFGCTDGIR